jgi:hypothetical protein
MQGNHQGKEHPQMMIKLQVKALIKLQFTVLVCLGKILTTKQ